MPDGRLHRSGLRIIDGGLAGEHGVLAAEPRDALQLPDEQLIDRLPVMEHLWLVRFWPSRGASPVVLVDDDLYRGLTEADVRALARIWVSARARGRALREC